METRSRAQQRQGLSVTDTGPGLNPNSRGRPTVGAKASAMETSSTARAEPLWQWRGSRSANKQHRKRVAPCGPASGGESDSEESSKDIKKPKVSDDQEENENDSSSKALVVAGPSVSLPTGRGLKWNGSWSRDDFVYSPVTSTVIGRKIRPPQYQWRRTGWPFSGFLYNPTPRRAPSNDDDDVQIVYERIPFPHSRFRRGNIPLRRPEPQFEFELLPDL